ncbi:MAG TPA: hypothetical protein VFO16_01355 [Pseudonocardiaceae bacterium]|nr:hypothetical protein [Pseudonocardiaceae bacterium]
MNEVKSSSSAPGSIRLCWIDFFDDQRLGGANGKFSGCVPAAADKIRAVIGNPAGYYLNVHSTAFVKEPRADSFIRGVSARSSNQ